MEYKNIKELLKKYWDGETDLQEESTLKTYFTGADVHPSLEQYQALFTYYKTAGEDKALDSIDAAVLAHIQDKAVPKQAKVRSLSRVLSIAAAVLILFGAVSVFWNTQGVNPPGAKITAYVDESDDAVAAYHELKLALAKVSNKLDTGKKQALKGLVKTKTISILKK